MVMLNGDRFRIAINEVGNSRQRTRFGVYEILLEHLAPGQGASETLERQLKRLSI